MTEFILTVLLIATGALVFWAFDRGCKRLAKASVVACVGLLIAYCVFSSSGWDWIAMRLFIIAMTAFLAGIPSHEVSGVKCSCSEDPTTIFLPLGNCDDGEKFLSVLILLCFLGCTYCA